MQTWTNSQPASPIPSADQACRSVRRCVRLPVTRCPAPRDPAEFLDVDVRPRTSRRGGARSGSAAPAARATRGCRARSASAPPRRSESAIPRQKAISAAVVRNLPQRRDHLDAILRRAMRNRPGRRRAGCRSPASPSAQVTAGPACGTCTPRCRIQHPGGALVTAAELVRRVSEGWDLEHHKEELLLEAAHALTRPMPPMPWVSATD